LEMEGCSRQTDQSQDLAEGQYGITISHSSRNQLLPPTLSRDLSCLLYRPWDHTDLIQLHGLSVYYFTSHYLIYGSALSSSQHTTLSSHPEKHVARRYNGQNGQKKFQCIQSEVVVQHYLPNHLFVDVFEIHATIL
jgi:hypothetical protein